MESPITLHSSSNHTNAEGHAAERMCNILLVEDDQTLAELTADFLRKRNFEVSVIHDGALALRHILALQQSRDLPKVDLVVLDVMLPGRDGLEICRELRHQGITVPIIMMTARDEDIDQVLGLELGADDYLSKPVQPRVLLAHIKAILRRTSNVVAPPESTSVLQFGELSINKSTRSVSLAEVPVDLTTAEFDLLWLLASNAGRVLPRYEILRELRGLDYDGIDRSIDSRISRLRRKLGEGATVAAHIKTVRPYGYLFSPAGWQAFDAALMSA